jgi:hypothetical protein
MGLYKELNDSELKDAKTSIKEPGAGGRYQLADKKPSKMFASSWDLIRFIVFVGDNEVNNCRCFN